jgi:hypothetical protein
VTARRFTGAVAFFTVETSSGMVFEVAGEPSVAREGDTVGIEPTGAGLHIYPANR